MCLALAACNSDASGPDVNNDLFPSVTLAASTGTFTRPLSSVPDASGEAIYFVATGANGSGVFNVPSSGGAVTEVFAGDPFVDPTDLVLSTDNRMIFVADSASGSILSLGVDGGTPTVVPGTAGTMPVALDLVRRTDRDRIYYCGANAASGQKAVFEIPSEGAGEATLRYSGSPLVDPTGIVSGADGTLYIADNGTVYRLSGTTLSEIAHGILMGRPGGIALTPDGRSIVVSSRSAGNGTAQVQIIDLSTGSMSIFNREIGANSNPAGLHVARDSSGATGVYSWADVVRGIYRMGP
jgi:DNA-binding beta-propeller fold protein YncE